MLFVDIIMVHPFVYQIYHPGQGRGFQYQTHSSILVFRLAQVKDGNTAQKMWICLFTYLAVRAIHLEIVKRLSAKLFLDSLRQFIAISGKPTTIISDNAPQFHLVESGLV